MSGTSEQGDRAMKDAWIESTFQVSLAQLISDARQGSAAAAAPWPAFGDPSVPPPVPQAPLRLDPIPNGTCSPRDTAAPVPAVTVAQPVAASAAPRLPLPPLPNIGRRTANAAATRAPARPPTLPPLASVTRPVAKLAAADMPTLPPLPPQPSNVARPAANKAAAKVLAQRPLPPLPNVSGPVPKIAAANPPTPLASSELNARRALSAGGLDAALVRRRRHTNRPWPLQDRPVDDEEGELPPDVFPVYGDELRALTANSNPIPANWIQVRVAHNILPPGCAAFRLAPAAAAAASVSQTFAQMPQASQQATPQSQASGANEQQTPAPARLRVITPVHAIQRPAVMQQAIDRRMITFEEMAKNIGHQPHPDLLGGRVRMSVNYKALGTAMPALKASLEAADARLVRDFTDDQHGLLVAQLDKVTEAGNAYLAQHARSPAKKTAVAPVVASATQYKQTLGAILRDPARDTLPATTTLQQAFELKRRGIAFADCKFSTFNDDAIKHLEEKFGAGACNNVSRLVYNDDTEWCFKPERATDPKPMPAAQTIGIDPTAPHYGNRNIASRAVAELLGADVIPKACYAMHKDQNGQDCVGLLMEKAPGRTPAQRAKDKWGDDSTPLVKPWTTKPSTAAVASLHQQLNALEWCDLLTGQMDRHAFNYLVEINGDRAVVTGIDNDFAFGEKEAIPACQIFPRPGFEGVTLPALIDRQTFKKLMWADSSDLMNRLDGLLSAKEIEASKARFDVVKKHALALEQQGYVVDDWDKWRAPRDEGRYFGAKKGMNATQYLSARMEGGLFGRDFAGFFR